MRQPPVKPGGKPQKTEVETSGKSDNEPIRQPLRTCLGVADIPRQKQRKTKTQIFILLWKKQYSSQPTLSG